MIVCTILAICVTAYGGETVNIPIEIGGVRWERDFDAASENSAKTCELILVLFKYSI